MNLRELEVIVEELNRTNWRIRSAQKVRINRQERTIVGVQGRRCGRASRRQVGRGRRELTLSALDADAGIDQGVVNGRVDNASVVESPTAANTGLAIAGDVEANPIRGPKLFLSSTLLFVCGKDGFTLMGSGLS